MAFRGSSSLGPRPHAARVGARESRRGRAPVPGGRGLPAATGGAMRAGEAVRRPREAADRSRGGTRFAGRDVRAAHGAPPRAGEGVGLRERSVLARCPELDTRSAAAALQGAGLGRTFVREADAWRIGIGARTSRVDDLLGSHFISVLSHPGEELLITELLRGIAGFEEEVIERARLRVRLACARGRVPGRDAARGGPAPASPSPHRKALRELPGGGRPGDLGRAEPLRRDESALRGEPSRLPL